MSATLYMTLNESDKVPPWEMQTMESDKVKQEAEQYLMRAQSNTDPVNVFKAQ